MLASRLKSAASNSTPRWRPSATSPSRFLPCGWLRPVAQCETAARVTPRAAVMSDRLIPASSRRLIALVAVMVTEGNRCRPACQGHVTSLNGNLRYPRSASVPRPVSKTVRPSAGKVQTFDIAKAIAKREAAGKSYADLGRALGLERQTIGHWFRRRGEPNVQQMKALAKELGCHWLELVTEETTVIHRQDEAERVKRMRQLGADQLRELDDFLAFKIAQRREAG